MKNIINTKKLIFLLSILLITGAFTLDRTNVPDKPEDISPLLIGENIPEVSLKNLDGKIVSLNKIVKEKPTILIFYRGGWCPFCNRQLSGIQEIEGDIQKLGYQILAVSPDKAENLKKTIDKNELKYTLLSDSKMEVCQAFGIAYINSKYGEMLVKASGEEHHMLPVPTVMVLDKDGKIKFEYINPNYKERLNPKLLLLAAELALKD